MILVALDAIADIPRTIVARVATHLGLTPAPALVDITDPLAGFPPDLLVDTVDSEGARSLLHLESVVTGPASASMTAPPHAHAIDALARLARHALIDGVTTTRDAGVASRWLDAHGLGTLAVTHFATAGSCAGCHSAIAEHMRARRLRVLIEHDPNVAHVTAEAGFPVILLDLPYNRALAHPRVLRAHDWRGITDLLLALPVDRRKDRRGF